MDIGPRFKVGAANTVVLDFEYDGGSVRVQCSGDVSIRTLLRFKRLASSDDEEAERLLREFGDTYILDWNLDGADDKPLPTTGEAFMGLPLSLMLGIIGRWADGLTVAPAPLEDASSSTGEALPARPIPMETLSASQAS